ncbi:MAG: 50S ribosomal protein L29 [Candidatus Cloacimonetes bacterium]|nr:50S ribosomal protein L29 [Candidatus Cloacimonadota bacterium]
MKMKDLRELSNEELNDKLLESREELFNLRFQKSMNKLENPGKLREVKKFIARLNTLLTERQKAVTVK